MSRGIVRKIDELGRITLPIEYRKTFGIKVKEQAPIGMYIENSKIHLVRVGDEFRGIARELDELGRLTLPIEIRRSLKFVDRQPVDLYVDGDEIIVVKDGKECIRCGADHELIEDDGDFICRTCLHRFWDKYQDRRG